MSMIEKCHYYYRLKNVYKIIINILLKIASSREDNTDQFSQSSYILEIID